MSLLPDTVLAVARGLRFVREEPRNSNKGQAVEAMLKLCGLGPGYPWCAAFVAWVGMSADPAWPLRPWAGCMSLYDEARGKDMIRNAPMRACVFLIWSDKLNRFAHTGFVTDSNSDGSWGTIEGNTNDGGSRDGWGVFARKRVFGPKDRFIYWWT